MIYVSLLPSCVYITRYFAGKVEIDAEKFFITLADYMAAVRYSYCPYQSRYIAACFSKRVTEAFKVHDG